MARERGINGARTGGLLRSRQRSRVFVLSAWHTCVGRGRGDGWPPGPRARRRAGGLMQGCFLATAPGRSGAASLRSARRPRPTARAAPVAAEPCGLGLSVTAGWRRGRAMPGLTEAAAQPRLCCGLSLSGSERRSRLGPPRPAATPRFAHGAPLHCALRCRRPLVRASLVASRRPPPLRGGHVVLGRIRRLTDAPNDQPQRPWQAPG